MAQTYTIPEVGDTISERYRLETEIGRGGFGVVFRATQIGMERVVAIKTLLPSAMAQEEMVERFRREAVLARNLNHPNTIRLYDFGETDSGLLYIVMEFLDGSPLDASIKVSGPIESARVKRMAMQVLKSLAEAHQHGIIHRDLKPANIFLTTVVGEEDFVKVLDFGIAKAFGQDAKSGKLTQTGIGFGTPRYMAPEQVRGKDICPATDLYALGLVMTECLTGEVVFKGESSMDVAVQQLSADPAPIPEWVLRGALGPVIQRATQKDVRLRYPSAAEMLRDLKNVNPNASIDISSKLNTREVEEIAAELDEPEEEEPPASRLPLFIGLGIAAIFFLVAVVAAVIMIGVAVTNKGGDDITTATNTTTTSGTTDKTAGTTGDGSSDGTSGTETKTNDGETNKDGEGTTGADTDAAKVFASVTTIPDGASLYDGEEYLGTSPVKLPFDKADGTKKIQVKLPGFTSTDLEVRLDADGDYQVNLEVEDEGKKPDKDPTVAKRPTTDKPPRDRGDKRPPRDDKNTGKKPNTNTNTNKPPKKDPGKVIIPKL